MPILTPNQYGLDLGFDGQVATVQGFSHITGTQDGLINASPDYIPFGRVVVRDPANPTANNCLVLPSATGQTPLGIAIYNDRFMAQTDDPRVTGFPPGQVMPILQVGSIYLTTETALTAGQALFFRHTENVAPGANEALGRIRGDADGGNADAFPTGTFRVVKSVASGEIATVKFQLSLVA